MPCLSVAVDDGNPSVVLWARIDRQGRQIGSVQPISLGASIDDPEGITSDGTYYYIVGSQSKTPFSGQPGIVRFRFDGQTQRVSNVAVASGLRGFSAPVRFEMDRTPDELAFLMAHDTDAFNRWEAAQRAGAFKIPADGDNHPRR